MTNVEGGSGQIKTCDPNRGFNFNPSCNIGEYCKWHEVARGQKAFICIALDDMSLGDPCTLNCHVHVDRSKIEYRIFN